MPVPAVAAHKNLWVASGDGDLNRVKFLVGEQGMSPNDPDPNMYTPMHAAASYGHLNVLDYFISMGGDVNVTDEDGDTPIYTAESVEVAKYLVDHGAIINRRNNEGFSPAEHLEEDFPEVAEYLRSSSGVGTEPSRMPAPPTNVPTEIATEQRSERLTESLMRDVQHIIAQSERDGTNPDEALEEAVKRIVLDGLTEGHTMADEQMEGTESEGNRPDRPAEESKRQRRD